MRDISLHLLDLMENAVRAEATLIAVRIEMDRVSDKMRIVIEDDGRGLEITPEEAVDPFRTTKSGKRTGLGLSLFKAAAERAGGTMALRPSDLGGLAVEATMQWSHVDRAPLGDIAETASGILCAAPRVALRCRFSRDAQSRDVLSDEVRRRIGNDSELALAAAVGVEVRTALHDLDITDESFG
jgi:hypothetical protein